MEHQPTNQWLLCCFHSIDSTKVTLRLGSLEALLKRYVKDADYSKLFASEDNTLKFNGQAAPIKKGKTQRVIQEVSKNTLRYATNAFRKVHTPAPKRLATEYSSEEVEINPSPVVVTPALQTTTAPRTPSPLVNNERFITIENTLSEQNGRLRSLEDCCTMLATSTKNLENQLVVMNGNIHAKMNEMTNTINNLNTSPKRRFNKVHKSAENPAMDLDTC